MLPNKLQSLKTLQRLKSRLSQNNVVHMYRFLIFEILDIHEIYPRRKIIHVHRKILLEYITYYTQSDNKQTY
jgi:hypothetical protein